MVLEQKINKTINVHLTSEKIHWQNHSVTDTPYKHPEPVRKHAVCKTKQKALEEAHKLVKLE